MLYINNPTGYTRGASANNSSGIGGSAALNVNNAPSNSNWNYGACLSFNSTYCFIITVYNPHLRVKISVKEWGSSIVDHRTPIRS